MKKLIILALMALLATGAFAQVTFTGLIEYETASSMQSDDKVIPNGNAGSATNSKSYGLYDGDIRLQANIKVDDYNTGFMQLRYRTQRGWGNSESQMYQAYFISDVGKAFALPIGWTSQLGLADWGFAPAGNGKWDVLNKILQRGIYGNPYHATYFFDANIWGIKEKFVFADVVTLAAWFSLQGRDNGSSEGNREGNARWDAGQLQDFYVDLVIAQAAGPGKLSLEAAYMLWSDNTINFGNGFSVASTAGKAAGNDMLYLNQGTMLFALGYTGVKAGDGMTVDFGGAYYLPMDDKVAYAGYAANVQLNAANVLKGLYLLVGMQGYPGNKNFWIDPETGDKAAQTIHNLRVAAGVKPVDILSIDVGTIFYLGGKDKVWDGNGTAPTIATNGQQSLTGVTVTDRKVFNTLDVSAALNVGKATYRIGYLNVPKNDISIDPFNTDALKTSLYFKGTLAF